MLLEVTIIENRTNGNTTYQSWTASPLQGSSHYKIAWLVKSCSFLQRLLMATLHNHYRSSITTSILYLTTAIWITIHSLTLQPTDPQCVRRMNSWSPAMNAIEYKRTTFLEVAFHIKSIYLSQPTAAAWDSLLPGR